MALVVETGAGVVGAESYASVATIDAYWAARSHKGSAAIWAALDPAKKEGATREATAYLDARYGERYRGVRQGAAQGLLWPRDGDDGGDVLDPDGLPLPDLPTQLQSAIAEFAVRAASGEIAPDGTSGGAVKSHKVGDVQVTFQDASEGGDVGVLERSIGFVDGLMRPLLRADALWPWR